MKDWVVKDEQRAILIILRGDCMKKLSKGMLMAAVITGTLFSASAYAAEEIQEFSLDPMIVTATRMEMKDIDTPASTTVITAQDIEKTGAKTVYEAIERQVGFTNNAYGPGGREFGGSCSRMVLRGLDKGTLVLVNGAPINMYNYNNPNGIPAEAIEKVEIVRGAQSVLYGSEATGGVVNIITKKGGKAKTTITGSVGNYDSKYGITSIGEKYVFSFSKDFLGDVGETNKVGEKSSYAWKYRNSSKLNGFLSVTPEDHLTVNYSHTEGNYYRDGWTPKNGQLTGAGTAYHYQDKRDNVSAVYDDKDNQFKAVISYNQREVNPYTGKIKNFVYPDMARATSSDWKISTATLDVQKGWKFNGDKDQLITGITLGKDKASDRTKVDQADRKNLAGYVSYNHSFSDKFSTIVGVRAVSVSDDYSTIYDQSGHMTKVLPQVQALYKVNDNNSLYVNAGKSFQMAPLNQYFGKGKAYRVGSDLKPQEGWTYEAGWKHISNSSSLKADVFYMDVDAKFDWTPKDDEGNQYMINAGTFRNLGVEVEYKKDLGTKFGYNLGAYMANPKTRDKDTDAYKQSEAKLQLSAGLDYKVGKFASNLNYLYVGKREGSYYLTNGASASKVGADHKVPHRSLLNANLTYTANKHHSFGVVLNNLLNNHDTINKYENWGMPFNWMATYKFSF